MEQKELPRHLKEKIKLRALKKSISGMGHGIMYLLSLIFIPFFIGLIVSTLEFAEGLNKSLYGVWLIGMIPFMMICIVFLFIHILWNFSWEKAKEEVLKEENGRQ